MPRPWPATTSRASEMTAAFSTVAAVWVLLLLGALGFTVAAGDAGFSPPHGAAAPPRAVPQAASHRKFLAPGGRRVGASTQRVDDGCDAAEDIAIYQGVTKPLPNGIPTYTVDVINECVAPDGNCAIAHVHVRCGWFSSVRLIEPRLFRRLRFNDCLLNDGRPLHAGDSISFTYANSFPYQMSVSSASCLGSP